MLSNASPNSAGDAIGSLSKLAQDVDNLKKLLDQLAPTLVMLNGTLQALKPLLIVYNEVIVLRNKVIHILSEDMADTPGMQREAITLIRELENYRTILDDYLTAVKSSQAFQEADQAFPLLTKKEIEMQRRPMIVETDKISKMVEKFPKSPDKSNYKEQKENQDSFIGLSLTIGLFAVPSARFLSQKFLFDPILKKSDEEEKALSRVDKTKREIKSSILSNIATLTLWTGCVSLGGRTIKQDFFSGARLGFTEAIVMLAIYETCRIIKCAVKESGLLAKQGSAKDEAAAPKPPSLR